MSGWTPLTKFLYDRRAEVLVVLGQYPVVAALLIITGAVLLFLFYWYVYRPVHMKGVKGRESELKATIAGLVGEKNILERQKADFEYQLTATRITTSTELAAALKESTVREAVDGSQLEGNAIVLRYTPKRDSVRLLIFNGTYVEQTSRGMVVSGCRIFLENVRGNAPLLELVQEATAEDPVVVEYQRCLSAEELDEIKRRR